METQTVTYERAPSKELCALLAPGEFLSPICDLHRHSVEVHDGLGLDVHFRRSDEIHAYCGLTRLFVLKRKRNGSMNVSADKEHAQFDCEGSFLREWRAHDDGFKQAMDNYLGNLKVNSRHTSKEGRVQMKWSRVAEPWISFDREARLQYRSREVRNATIFEGVEAAYSSLCANYNKHRNNIGKCRWAKIEKGARKLDQLAVDTDGRLVLIELKDAEGGQSKEIYYSPFQVLQYVWEWHEALKNNAPQLLAQVQSLLDSRVALCLTEAPAARLTGDIRAAVCFGQDRRSDEVRRRYRFVLDICNRHLPESVGPIETWEYGAPRRIPNDG